MLCCVGVFLCFFFFSSRRRHTRCSRDWSSDVCSSDLFAGPMRPDHAAMIGAHRARESDVSEGAEDLEQVHAAAGRGMSGLVKLAVTRDPDVATDRSSLALRSEEHTSELQSRLHLVCRLLLEKKKK